MIVSSAEIGGVARAEFPLSLLTSMGASCGRATKPPAGMDPRLYSDSVDLLFPNRFAEPDAEFFKTSPRHRAARKCPSSWTMIIRLKKIRTSRQMKRNLKNGEGVDMSQAKTGEERRVEGSIGQPSAKGVQTARTRGGAIRAAASAATMASNIGIIWLVFSHHSLYGLPNRGKVQRRPEKRRPRSH